MFPTVRIGDEEFLVEIRNGRVHIEGYDVESERVALALNHNIGEGPGVFLVAVDDMLLTEVSSDITETRLKEEINTFKRELPELRNEYSVSPRMQTAGLLYSYISYSPHVLWRESSARSEYVARKTYLRLMQDKDEYVVCEALSWAKGVDKELLKFIHSPKVLFRESLAQNPALPWSALWALAHDVKSVRTSLSEQKGLSHEIMAIIMANDVLEDFDQNLKELRKQRKEARATLKRLHRLENIVRGEEIEL